MKISIIGYGNMAKAIAQGLLRDEAIQLYAASPSLPIGVNEDGIHTHFNNLAIIPQSDVIILAVKPAQLPQVLEQIKLERPANCLVISIASGFTFERFKQLAGLNWPIIRAMPNIAAAVSQSATPLIANEHVTDAQKEIAQQLFSRIGRTTWAESEAAINAFTALSGSGPAYIFLFMEAMISAAEALGLPNEIATSFTLQTVQGALSLAVSRDTSLAQLRAAVTSPAGTTAAAIAVLESHDFSKLIHDAMQAAHDRSIQLGLI